MRELDRYLAERVLSEERQVRSAKFMMRTLPPTNMLSFFVVWWFAGRDMRIVGLAVLFLVFVLVVVRPAKSFTSTRMMGVLLVNMAIFVTTALMAGGEAPGWLLFIPPLVPATLVLQRHRVLVTVAINAVCLGVNVLTAQPLHTLVPVAIVFAVVSALLLRVTQHLHLQAGEIERERARSDHLLDAVLPASISRRIKNGEGHIVERYDEATILFADIAGFTPLSEKLPPEKLVAFLNEIFTLFDALVARHGLEKIKTIGDAYMVASGLADSRHDMRAVADFALDLVDAIAEIEVPEAAAIGVRVGIQSGPVVAGIVGTQRFVYDVWGDTVNTAARMESHGVVNAIQVTETVRQALSDEYAFEPRGAIAIKGKGDMNVWLLRQASKD
jgi:class 3 adenylate cyclase